MYEIDEKSAAFYAIERGLFPAATSLAVQKLAGGVSNVVLRVSDRASGREVVFKQSREKLQVAADWRSRLDRIWNEVEALRTLERATEAGCLTGLQVRLPQVLYEDRENYLFAMSAVPQGHSVWKHDLLAGRLDSGILPALGYFLGTVHRVTANGAVPHILRDTQVFDELRLDPYYRWTAGRNAAARPQLLQLIEDTQRRADALTLGDFSPKNILLHGKTVTVVDFETAHLGDPAFDLGFFLSHLVLKSLHVPSLGSELLGEIALFQTQYRRGMASAAAESIERQSMRHLAACLLARVDGKSPVDYLMEGEQSLVRRFAVRQLSMPSDAWPAFADAARQELLSPG